MFGALLFIGAVLFIIVKAVNNSLSNPADFSDSQQSSKPKDPDFEPIEPQTESESEPEQEYTFEQESHPEPEPVFENTTSGHLFGLIGKPLAHSTSMVRFNKFFREQHINAHYNNYELESIEDVTRLIEKYPNLCGFNVTIPYKEDIIPYLNRLDETAQAIGAVNTVKVQDQHLEARGTI